MGNLPKSWVETTIENCFSEVKNGTTIKQNKEGIGYPVSRIESIQNRVFDLNRLGHIAEITEEQLNAYKYKMGDIALSHINSYEHVGKTAIYEGNPEVFIHGMNLLRLRFGHDYIYPKFVYYFMQANYFREEVRSRVGHAVNQVSINQKNLSKVPIILAPINEQKRIVAKLEKLLAEVDTAQERLEKIPQILKRFRQSVLMQAVTGELTKDWREQNPDSTWKETTLEKVVTSYKNGLSKRSGKEGEEVVVLRLADFTDNKITTDKVRKIKVTERELEQYKLDFNDILVIRVNGSEDIVGRFILFDREEDWIYCDHIIRLRYDKSLLDPYYIFYFAQTHIAREHIRLNKVSSAGQNTISQGTLNSMPLFLPSLEEQQEIVKRVKALFEKADKIEERYKKAKSYTDKLTQSILNKAFKGELVPQDPSDEPASVLLERIKTSE